MQKQQLRKIIKEELQKAVKEASGQLTTYLDPKQKQALVATTQKLNELMAAINNASKIVSHKDITNWLGLSKQELTKIQARLNQIDLS